MHIINLGVDLWICGSIMRKILSSYDQLWGGSDLEDSDRLLLAYDDFRSWSRRNRIAYLALKKKVFAYFYRPDSHNTINYVSCFWLIFVISSQAFNAQIPSMAASIKDPPFS